MAYLGGVLNTADVYTGQYDNLNRLRRVYQAGAGATVTPKLAYFTFDALDHLTVINRGEYDDQEGWNWTVTDSYAFDADSRMTGLTHLKGPTTLVTYTWTYDRASRPTGFTSSLDDTRDYTYDETGQLLTADYDYQTDEAYSYDSNGNRTNSGYSTGDANRLLCDGTYTYQYDSEGNRTARFVDEDSSGTLTTGDTEVTEYAWDYRNRLTNVTNRATYGGDATQVVDYIYDVNNRLVGRLLDPDSEGDEEATEEYYAYDQTPFSTREDAAQILFRFEGSELSDLKSRYLWAPVVDLLLSDEKLTGPSTPGDIYWALGDNLNTVRDIARYDAQTDTTTIVNHRVFDAFGNLTSESNSAVDLIFAFTGRLFDESTGLQNNLNRWYDPTIGRWLSEDPIGFRAADANLYRYVHNAPTQFIDPLGLWKIFRNRRPTAYALSEGGDTIESLAYKIGLEPAQWESRATPPSWYYMKTVQMPGGVTTRTGAYGPALRLSDKRIVPLPASSDVTTLELASGNVFYIPNTMVSLWIGDLNWWGIGRGLVGWGNDNQKLHSLGFYVVPYIHSEYGFSSSEIVTRYFQNLSARKELHGMFVTGHGNCTSFGEKKACGLTIYYQQIRDFTNYKLGAAIMYLCHGACDQPGVTNARDLVTSHGIFYGRTDLFVPLLDALGDIRFPWIGGRQGTGHWWHGQ